MPRIPSIPTESVYIAALYTFVVAGSVTGLCNCSVRGNNNQTSSRLRAESSWLRYTITICPNHRPIQSVSQSFIVIEVVRMGLIIQDVVVGTTIPSSIRECHRSQQEERQKLVGRTHIHTISHFQRSYQHCSPSNHKFYCGNYHNVD